MESIHPLSIILFLPAVGAILIAFLIKQPKLVKIAAGIFTFVPFALSVALFAMFDRTGGLQFIERAEWIPSINASYFLGADGLSLPMVILTAFLGFVCVFISWKIGLRTREYFVWLLLLETGILGVFLSLDFLLFFLFWEVELIPMYMLISIWGSGRKEYSAIKFVIYTLFGSAFMLAGILTLYFSTSPSTFDMVAIAGGAVDLLPVIPLAATFFLIFVAFAIKLPVFPVHTWLPDAHTDAPTAVSVILAGVLLKMGAYGMIRLVAGYGEGALIPGVAETYATLLIIFAVVSILYGAAATIRQTDLKRLIAYSSVSHMGFVLLGVFALSQVSLSGATLQMFSHGLVTGLLFAMVGLVYDKTHQRQIPLLGGLARQMPVIAVVFSIAGLAALGLPTTIGFAAEFTVFVGSFQSTVVNNAQTFVVLAILGVVLGAAYILWMLERVFYREPKEQYDGVKDADHMEKAYIFAFSALILLFGIYPRLLLDVIGPVFTMFD
ncbi:MAG: NADH-quinone oxidoreductase subunit M [Dehalococcoidia bacterium]|nr:NADH-quinone oxidoreductase subunit M [Dehalococcoidia bacterium]